MKPAVTPLFGGRALAEWIREGCPTERRVRGYLPRLWWHAFWFEHNWQTQVARLGDISLPEDPVFIVGLWRSGTTVFHEYLAAMTGWAAPRSWQCFNPSTCFLTRQPIEVSVQRPMDQGRIETRSPQEDEFALLLLGEPSLYRAFIDPRRLSECAERAWNAGDVPLKRWQTFLQGISLAANGARLLLKSPSHTFRLPLLHLLFPRAKFVWIARSPREVLPSNLKMWRAMLGRYALWGCPDGALERVLDDMLRACTCTLDRCIDEMPQEKMTWVDFDELRADPKKTLRRVLGFLKADSSLYGDAFTSNLDRALTRLPILHGSAIRVSGSEATESLERVMIAARKRFGDPL